MIHDVGVAGPHRLTANLPLLEDADAVVVVAGMEGALPSVVGGYVACPVIAVPTSVGYGASFGGVAALLGMLNSCAANVTRGEHRRRLQRRLRRRTDRQECGEAKAKNVKDLRPKTQDLISSMKTKLNTRDAQTLKRLKELADEVAAAAAKRRDPFVDVPARSLSNVKYNKTKRFIEMGRNTNRRQLFNLSQAKSYMQTMLVASGATQLIEQGKTTSIRGLYYLLKHTIEGDEGRNLRRPVECDPIIEDVEVLLNTSARGIASVRPKARRHGGRYRTRSTAATRSTARGWAPAATASRRSSSRR